MNARSTYTKRMQVVAYIAATISLWGVIPGLGVASKHLGLDIPDGVVMMLVGGLLTQWQRLTDKIFRIFTAGEQQKNPE